MLISLLHFRQQVKLSEMTKTYIIKKKKKRKKEEKELSFL